MSYKKEVALTYDDIQLIPSFSNIKSRKDIKLHTLVSRQYGLLNPLVASPMDTVCELDMAYKMAVYGGAGIIHRFMTIEEQCKQVDMLVTKLVNNNTYNVWASNGIANIPIIAAIGVGEEQTNRAKRLVRAGANVLVIDVAHGHHQNVFDMIRWCKKNLPTEVDIIAGNVATAEAAIDLETAGVDGIRINVGNGSLCTSRKKTGFGIPSVTCLEWIREVATVPIMADGGIRNSGDIAKAMALGASTVLIGSLLAGTDEAPGGIIETPNGLFKRYRGSASRDTKLAHGMDDRNVEGESTIVPYKGGVKYIISDLLDGLRSALSYGGANNLSEFFPKYIQVTNAGIIEASPHLLK